MIFKGDIMVYAGIHYRVTDLSDKYVWIRRLPGQVARAAYSPTSRSRRIKVKRMEHFLNKQRGLFHDWHRIPTGLPNGT